MRVRLLLLAALNFANATPGGGCRDGNCKPGDFFKICNRSGNDLEDCIKSSMHAMRPRLKKGIPALKMASIDPMFVPALRLVQGAGAVTLDASYTNLSVSGISNFEVLSVAADLDHFRLDMDIAVPYLHIEGGYVMRGRVLVLPIAGSGDTTSNYTGVTGRARIQGHPETRNGKTYMALDDFQFAASITGSKVHLTNLFNGNKELGEAMNRFLNENWKLMFAELQPVVNEAVGSLLKNLAVRVFDKFPLDELFPK